jgi:hypothetical protein
LKAVAHPRCSQGGTLTSASPARPRSALSSWLRRADARPDRLQVRHARVLRHVVDDDTHAGLKRAADAVPRPAGIPWRIGESLLTSEPEVWDDQFLLGGKRRPSGRLPEAARDRTSVLAPAPSWERSPTDRSRRREHRRLPTPTSSPFHPTDRRGAAGAVHSRPRKSGRRSTLPDTAERTRLCRSRTRAHTFRA